MTVTVADVEEFYKIHNPAKISNAAALAEKLSAEEVLRGLYKQYGAVPKHTGELDIEQPRSSGDFTAQASEYDQSDAEQTEVIAATDVEEFYKIHNPAKISNAAALVEKLSAEEVLRGLHKQYGAVPKHIEEVKTKPKVVAEEQKEVEKLPAQSSHAEDPFPKLTTVHVSSSPKKQMIHGVSSDKIRRAFLSLKDMTDYPTWGHRQGWDECRLLQVSRRVIPHLRKLIWPVHTHSVL